MREKSSKKETMFLDWPALMDFKRTFTVPHPQQREGGFKDAGIETYHGIVRFASEFTRIVGDQRSRTNCIAIATVPKPRMLNIPGEEYFVTSEQFMKMENIPERIIFAGGGYISFEFAHVAARAGSEVTILQRGDRVLKEFDPDLVDFLVKASEDAGIPLNIAATWYNGKEQVHIFKHFIEVEWEASSPIVH